MHLWLSLPTNLENGAKRALTQDKEVVDTDGGYEVRNTRWASPLRSWTASFNNAQLTDANHAAVEAMWRNTNSGTDTFNFYDERTGDTARVRFDSDINFTNALGPYYHLDQFMLKEVRDISPTPTVIPLITGTPHAGNTLNGSNGTWAGSPTGYAYQWYANGVAIGGATANSYVVLSGDNGKLITFSVVATDVYGGQTKVWSAAVGPVA